jgi:hypothetical protein
MVAPKPITLTQVSTEDYDGAVIPAPFVVVGDIPGEGGASVNPQAAPTIDGSPADAAAVATDLQAVVDALVAAGVLTA